MRTTPRFWIEELRILRHWSPEPSAEVRRITFRRGLNIIWAQAAHADQPALPGFGGHAAGKTSLCRLLRFVLGEPHYGSRFMRDRILTAFEDGWVAAKVWLEERSWIVARPFRSGLHPVTCVGETIDSLFDPVQVPGRYEDFRQALESAALRGFPLREFPSQGEAITFAHLLEWLARDQECRLSGLLEWRHPASNHESPGMSAEEKRFLLRVTLGLVDDQVSAEIRQRHGLEEELEKIPGDLHYRRRTLHDLLAALREVPGTGELPAVGEPLFVDAVQRLAQSRRDAALAPLEAESHALNLPALRTDLARLTEELGARRWQEKTLRQEVEARQVRPAASEHGFCGIPLEQARLHCPLHQQPPADRQPAVRTESSLKAITTERLALEAEVGRVSQAVAAAEARRDALQEQRHALRHEHTLTLHRAEQAAQLCEEIDQLAERQTWLERQIEESKARQEELQKRRPARLSAFSDLYESTLKAFLGEGIQASCRFTREEIDLRAEYNGELSSAAIDTLKMLAFDIAALRSGLQERSCHPGFIIFDSPREADMHPTPYQRIFHHLKALEPAGKPAPFQVILTTTEPPPATLQQSEEMVLRLDASAREGRVFRTDF